MPGSEPFSPPGDALFLIQPLISQQIPNSQLARFLPPFATAAAFPFFALRARKKVYLRRGEISAVGGISVWCGN
jgi:hypothetical protein